MSLTLWSRLWGQLPWGWLSMVLEEAPCGLGWVGQAILALTACLHLSGLGGATQPRHSCGSRPLSLRPGAVRRSTLAPGVGLLHPSMLLGWGLHLCLVQQLGCSPVPKAEARGRGCPGQVPSPHTGQASLLRQEPPPTPRTAPTVPSLKGASNPLCSGHPVWPGGGAPGLGPQF